MLYLHAYLDSLEALKLLFDASVRAKGMSGLLRTSRDWKDKFSTFALCVLETDTSRSLQHCEVPHRQPGQSIVFETGCTTI